MVQMDKDIEELVKQVDTVIAYGDPTIESAGDAVRTWTPITDPSVSLDQDLLF